MMFKKIVKSVFLGLALVSVLGAQVSYAQEDGINIMDERVTELARGGRYYIEDAEGLVKLSKLQAQGKVAHNTSLENGGDGAYIYLANDVDVSDDWYGDTQPNTGEFKPIGNMDNGDYTKIFGATFDGKGHKIKVKLNKNSDSVELHCVGVFGAVGNFGIICNLGVEGNIAAENTDMHVAVGGIAGAVVIEYSNEYNNNTIFTLIKNCWNTATIRGKSTYVHLGGICGDCWASSIENCYNTGNIEAEGDDEVHLGGVVGRYEDHGLMKNCYNTGNIKGESKGINGDTGEEGTHRAFLGGLVGIGPVVLEQVFLDSVTKNCYNTGAINASLGEDKWDLYMGGIGGLLVSDVISCYNTGSLNIEGNGETVEKYIGGIAGEFYSDFGKIKNSYCRSGCASKLVGELEEEGTVWLKNSGFKTVSELTSESILNSLNAGATSDSKPFKYAEGYCQSFLGKPKIHILK